MGQWKGPFIWNSVEAGKSNFSDGYQFGDIWASAAGYDRNAGSQSSSSSSGTTSSALSFEEYSGIKDPYSALNKIDNFFSGKTTSAEKAYQNYLADYEFRRNQEATAKANQETWMREDSAVQRLMEDYRRAGLNPYLLLTGGNLSGGVVSSQSQKASYKRKALEEGKLESKFLSSAIKILALLILKKKL